MEVLIHQKEILEELMFQELELVVEVVELWRLEAQMELVKVETEHQMQLQE